MPLPPAKRIPFILMSFHERRAEPRARVGTRVASLAERVGEATGAERAALATQLAEVRTAVRAEKLGEVAVGFDPGDQYCGTKLRWT